MKSWLAVAVGLFYVLMGVVVAISPEWFLGVVDWTSREGKLTGAAMRVVVGISLLLAASGGKYPRTLKAFGALALLAGLLMPFVPMEAWTEYAEWWLVEHVTAFRWMFAIATTLFGGFVAYAAMPKLNRDDLP